MHTCTKYRQSSDCEQIIFSLSYSCQSHEAISLLTNTHTHLQYRIAVNSAVSMSVWVRYEFYLHKCLSYIYVFYACVCVSVSQWLSQNSRTDMTVWIWSECLCGLLFPFLILFDFMVWKFLIFTSRVIIRLCMIFQVLSRAYP